jgi:hypothetical protein
MSCCGGKRAQLTRTLAGSQPQRTTATPRAHHVVDPHLRDAILAYLARRAKRPGRTTA